MIDPKQLGLAELEKQHSLPSGLLTAVMHAESAGNPNAVSKAGALGLFQFMPKTAKAYGINPLDPQQAAVGAARMYGDLNKQYNGDLPSMLAAYNWGSGNIQNKGMANMPQETRDYIAKITRTMGAPVQMAGNTVTKYTPMSNETTVNPIDAEIAALEAELYGSNGSPTASKNPLDAEIAALEADLARPVEKKQPMTPLGAFVTGFGMNLPFGDEIGAALGTWPAAFSDKTVGEIYDKNLARLRGYQKESMDGENWGYGLAGQIVGGLATGAAGMASAPLRAAALASPVTTAAATGAASGALYGAGAGEGDAATRAESALWGGLGGGILGGAFGYAGKTVSDKIASSAKDGALAKFAEKYGRKVVTNNKQTPLVALTDQEASFVPALQKPEGQMFSKTAGQRTQNAALQRLENSAVAGNLSTDANDAAQAAMTMQNRQFKDYLGKLAGGIDEGKDVPSIVENIARAIKTQADDAYGAVRSAYDVARAGGRVKIDADTIRQGLFKNIVAVKREGQFDLSTMPQANSVYRKLATITKGYGGGKITAVQLHALEKWRTAATTAAANAMKGEKTLLGRMVRQYDDFMENTATNAVNAGDAEAINAFKAAVKSRAQYGRLYESNRLVKDIVGGKKSVDDVAKDLIGAGAIKGKKQMSANLDAILAAAGKEKDNVLSDLRQAFGHKILRAAESGFEPNNPNASMVSPAKLATQLENLFVNQRSFAVKLYGKEAVDEGMKAVSELKLIAQKQPKVGSSSGSGEVIEGLLKRSPLLSRIPGISEVVDSIKTAHASNKVVSSLDEFRTTPRSKFWGSVPIGTATGSGIQPTPSELPQTGE